MTVYDLLPVGSIVRLKDGETRLMISGILQRDANNPEVEYDYVGILYPEGHVGADFQYLFNQDDIEEIFFEGFHDEERDDFLNRLNSVLSGQR